MTRKIQALAFLLASTAPLSGQLPVELPPVLQSHAHHLGRSLPLRDLHHTTAAPAGAEQEPDREIPNFRNIHNTAAPRSGAPAPDGALQRQPGTAAALPLLLNVDGIDYLQTGPAFPPDPTGEAGPDHYIQMTNASDGAVFEVFDKQGQVLQGPMGLNGLWQQFGATGEGDGIVLYDQQYQRWLLTEFSGFFSGPNRLLLAVSVGPDPLGAWEAYDITTPGFPDYPKYALWGDALLITANEPGANVPVYAVHRQDLFTLQAAPRVQRLAGIPKFGISNFIEAAAPADVEGNTPPSPGSPPLVLRVADDQTMGGSDRVEIFSMNINWDQPAASAVNLVASLPMAAFSLNDCPTNQGCIPVPGSNQQVAAIAGVLMNRVTYRNFGAYASLLLHFTVFVDAQHAAVRWAELRKAGAGPWTVFQQSTFAPDDNNRWMGSLAQDGAGNIALGCSVMGPGIRPSLRVTGHHHNDAPGQMDFAEAEVGAGQAFPLIYYRWGDYFNMSVDPADDRTFWFTGHYAKYPEHDRWGTRIAAFRIERDTHDIGPVALLTPADSDALGSTEPVTVRLYNYGQSPESGFQVGYIADQQAPVLETVNATLAPGEYLEHSFTVPADLSAFGGHPVRLFTRLNGDQSVGNDTLRHTVYHRTQNDAGVVDVLGVDNPLCPSTDSLELLVQNFGTHEIQSFQANWRLNNAAWQMMPVHLTIPPGASVPVKVPVALTPGGTFLLAYTSLPNGVPDEGPANDTLRHLIPVLNNGETVRFELRTDAKPNETAWFLTGANGEAIASSPSPLTEAQHVYEYSTCLSTDECYTFQLFDFGSDGLAAGTPPGDLRIFRANGDPLYQLPDPNFGATLLVPVCLDPVCAGLSAVAEIRDPSSPFAQDGQMIIHASGGTPPYAYSYDNQFSYVPDSVLAGIGYFSQPVYVKDAAGCVFPLYVLFQDCGFDAALAVTNTPAGANAGQIVVNVSGGAPPFQYSLDSGAPQSGNTFSGVAAGNHSVCVSNSLGCRECYFALVGTSAGVATAAADLQIRVTPNPAGDFFRIEAGGWPGVQRLPFYLSDAAGRILRRGELTRWGEQLLAPVDARRLPAGVYFVRLCGAGSGGVGIPVWVEH